MRGLMRTGIRVTTPAAEHEHRPGLRCCLDGRVLTCDGFDDSVRWRAGERLEHLFERALRLAAPTGPGRSPRGRRRGRLAELRGAGRAGEPAGALPDPPGRPARRPDRPAVRRAVDGYVGMLAVLKAHAAFVPLDASFPADRVAYIASDARVRLILTRSHLAARLGPLASQVELAVRGPGRGPDRRRTPRPVQPRTRCRSRPTSLPTSSTRPARPAGPRAWRSSHASICNFVRVAAEVYGISRGDRVLPGHDDRVRLLRRGDLGAPGCAGATLVPKPDGGQPARRGPRRVPRERQVTALCCVPTLLATLERDLPELRFLLVSGEACPRTWSPAGIGRAAASSTSTVRPKRP